MKSDMPPNWAETGATSRRSLGDMVKTYFLTGVVVAAPVIITAFLFVSLVSWVDGLVRPLLPAAWLKFAVPGIGLALVFTGLVLLGAITANVIGRWLVRVWDALLLRVPFISTIYRPVKQVFETVIGPGAMSFREVVLAPYPHPDSRCLAFVTAEAPASLAASSGFAEPQVFVFVPTAPNLYAGFVMLLPRSALKPVDMSVDDAIRTIVSLGIAHQPERKKAIAASREKR